MVLDTSSNTAGLYIVVLDVVADAVRALLFDSEARRMEGYSAQLPLRADAAADCLDEMHRLVRADGFRIGAVVGRAESELTAEDRAYWPGFEGAHWFPAVPHAVMLGCGCVNREQFGLVIDGEKSLLGCLVDFTPQELPDGMSLAPVDERRWLMFGALPEAGGAYAAVKQSLNIKGSIEGYLESAAADDPHLAPMTGVARRFREIYRALSRAVGKPSEVIACGSPLLKSASWTQRIATEMGTPLTLCTEPEPAARGAALWALERIGAIEKAGALAASTARVYKPETEHMNFELLERASRVKMLLMDVDGVLTDAKLYTLPGPNGTTWETKAFDAQDGIALQWLSWYGIQTGVISGRVSPAVEERARQVKMTHVYQGHIEKIPILQQICEKSGIPLDAMAYVGDDLTDVVVMHRVLLGIAPANARPEVKKAAHFVTSASGGAGAIREVCEMLLQAQGKWPEILKKYELE
jgi:3-deoxy-D-manno-octulosonate 8-phosphate phosphatase (KDO 8-P phosphatase)